MSSDVYRSYTRAEQRERARLILRGSKQALAGTEAIDPRVERRIETIDARAADRGAREADALFDQHDQAKNGLARARAVERAARRGQEKAAAKAARKEAEQRAKATERAIRRAGLA